MHVDERLYGCGVNEILSLIHSQSSSVSKLMVFGHNPDFSELARTFAKKPFIELATCGIVIFDFQCSDWKEIGKSNLKNEYYDFPKKES